MSEPSTRVEVLVPGGAAVESIVELDRVRLRWRVPRLSQRASIAGIVAGTVGGLYGAVGAIPLMVAMGVDLNPLSVGLAMAPALVLVPLFALPRLSRYRELELTSDSIILEGTAYPTGERARLTARIRRSGRLDLVSREVLEEQAKVERSRSAGQSRPTPAYGLDLDVDGGAIPVLRGVTPAQALAVMRALETHWPAKPQLADQEVDAEAERALNRLRQREPGR